jgi:hypothetical protein
VSVHGLFENANIAAAVVGRAPTTDLNAVFDGLADAAEAALDVPLLLGKAGV